MLLVFGTLHTETAFFIAAPIMGVTAFVCAPLLAAMVAEIAGPALVGSATGMTNAFWQLGNVLVPLAVGVAYQSTNSFGAAQRNVELMWLTGRLARTSRPLPTSGAPTASASETSVVASSCCDVT